MKLAVMQPYFFPYLGYFSLIKHTERFILLDTVQYIYHGWIARNRILKPNTGWQYVIVPLRSHSRDTVIRDIRIHNESNWKERIIAQLQHYKKRAPYFTQIENLIRQVFAEQYEDITSLNHATLKAVSNYLQIERTIEIFSKMDVSIEATKDSDEWGLNICIALGDVEEYWNPLGGKTFFDREKYEKSKIKLLFHEIDLIPYSQKRGVFEPGLSIIDVLMYNSISEVHEMLDKFSLT